MWPLETIPPPNTANRNKRRMVNFDFTAVNSGAKEALKWGGDDKRDRERIRKRPPSPVNDSPRPSQRNTDTQQPDPSTYVSSWATTTIPNHAASKTFTMKDTILLPSHGRRSEKRPISRGVTSSKLSQYSAIPVEIERQKSNLLLKPAVSRKRPGILDTINAADHAIKHIQVKNDQADESYQHLIDFHHRRYINAQIEHPNYITSFLESSKTLSVSDPALSRPEDQWNKDNWRSKISRTYKEDYKNMLAKYKQDHRNHNSGIVKNFYKNSEDDLSTQMDLRRYHHAI